MLLSLFFFVGLIFRIIPMIMLFFIFMSFQFFSMILEGFFIFLFLESNPTSQNRSLFYIYNFLRKEISQALASINSLFGCEIILEQYLPLLFCNHPMLWVLFKVTYLLNCKDRVLVHVRTFLSFLSRMAKVIIIFLEFFIWILNDLTLCQCIRI